MTITIIVALAITLYAYTLIIKLKNDITRLEVWKDHYKKEMGQFRNAFEDEIERTKDLKEEYEAFQKDMQEFISALPIKKTKKKTCNVKTVK